MGSDCVLVRHIAIDAISIHAPRVGSDAGVADLTETVTISIHAPRVGSDHGHPHRMTHIIISIHAPRVGSDTNLSFRTDTLTYFNPRSPRGERLCVLPRIRRRVRFQSTLPAWGATIRRFPLPRLASYFNPRSPRGERLQSAFLFRRRYYFNPRSPRGERRRQMVDGVARADFNPRSPRGERPHARLIRPSGRFYFNPRSPRGERLEEWLHFRHDRISIHAPRVGSDSRCSVSDSCLLHKHFCANRRCADFWLPYHALPADVHFMFDRPSR